MQPSQPSIQFDLMAARMKLILMALMVLTVGFVGVVDARKHPRTSKVAMFVMGDSIFDAGNNIYLPGSTSTAGNHRPYGESHFKEPTGRFSDGLLIPDFMSKYLGLPLLEPYLKAPNKEYREGVNMASGGSGLLDSTNKHLGVIPMTAQLQHLRDLAVHSKKVDMSHSLVLISTGGNDIAVNMLNLARENMSIADLVKSTMYVYGETLEGLYDLGFRRIVVFNVGPLGCAPIMKLPTLRLDENKCVESVNQVVKAVNGALQLLVNDISRKLPGLKVAYANSFDMVTSFAADGKRYGFTNTEKGCCPNCFDPHAQDKAVGLCEDPSRYLFWDIIHPTQKAYSLLAREFWEGKNYIHPFNVKALSKMR